jgi:hypothetical protein
VVKKCGITALNLVEGQHPASAQNNKSPCWQPAITIGQLAARRARRVVRDLRLGRRSANCQNASEMAGFRGLDQDSIKTRPKLHQYSISRADPQA